MNENVPFPEGTKSLLPGGDCGMEKGKMRVQSGAVVHAIGIKVVHQITSSGTVTAFTETQRLALLAALSAYFTTGHSLGEKIEAYQNEGLKMIRGESKRLLEVDMRGFTDSTEGLARAYASGNNKVAYTVFLAISHAEFIDESKQCLGLGAEQLLDSSVLLKLGADPFKAVSSSLTLASTQVTWFPVMTDPRQIRIGVPVMVRSVTNADSDSITTPVGQVLSLEDTTAALASTSLTRLKVTVGSRDVGDEMTPAAVQASYVAAPDTGALEASNADERTPVYLVPDGPLNGVRTGAVVAKQLEKTQNWKGRVAYLPLLTTEQVLGMVAQVASTLPAGKQLLAVNAAAVEGLKVMDEHLPYTGMVCFTSDDPRFYEYSGLRCASTGRPVVHHPPHMLASYAARIRQAMRPSKLYPTGDSGLVLALKIKAVRDVPGAVDSPLGFASKSWVAAKSDELLDAAVAEAAERERQAAAELEKKGIKLSA